MAQKGPIPPSDMDPRQGDAPAELPAARHPGAAHDAIDGGMVEDVDAPPAEI